METEPQYPPLATDPEIAGKSEEEVLEAARRVHEENKERDGEPDRD